MKARWIIARKRDGHELDAGEINFMVDGFVKGEIPDYQMSAFLMAIYLKGMTPREIGALTLAMVRSGETIDLGSIRGRKVDKHSTGGVGDKTTLVLGPLVAAAGAPVAKMSGRALGHTGGTIDKLESIPGFRVSLSREEFISNVNRIGIAISGQTGNLAPADKKIYALRDVTATVESVPLIASSIMSKKIAAGADAIVLDVKAGKGAFMKTLDEAFGLATAMIAIGHEAGRRVVAVVSDMNQPLGRAIGNALEVKEAIETLKGSGPPDLTELCLVLGSHMLVLAGIARDADEGRARLEDCLASGAGLRKFEELIQAQGGDAGIIAEPSRLPGARVVKEVASPGEGYVHEIDALKVGRLAMELGAGRERVGDPIDYSVGMVLKKKVGDGVAAGEVIAEVHASSSERAGAAAAELAKCYRIEASRPAPPALVYGVL
ncbi:MAG TPA: pyrimidine-nucleoside phosphorylase [Firmicutes bacterium]|nr:pyrimidine-nucleoside phosphorylase [Bacillota bacterium]